LNLLMSCKVCLLGAHDQAVLFDPEGFNATAERAIFWTRRMLEAPDPPWDERRFEFLGDMPRVHREPGLLYVHGSPRNPVNEYVHPEDIYNQRKMERLFALIDRYCFNGHTHVPGIHTEDLNFLSPREFDFRYSLGPQKTMINVGSVGQPGDADNRASYVILDEGLASRDETAASSVQEPHEKDGVGMTVLFRRVPYNFEQTIAKIYKIDELDNFLGDFLRDGRALETTEPFES